MPAPVAAGTAPAGAVGGAVPAGGARDDMARLVQGGFSEREARELLTLRDAGYQVGEAETRLGYSSEARTLSRRLRGMTLKALSVSDADVERTAMLLLAGDPALQAIVVRRVQKVVDSVIERLGEPDEAQVDGLPADYRRHALIVIAALRAKGR